MYSKKYLIHFTEFISDKTWYVLTFYKGKKSSENKAYYLWEIMEFCWITVTFCVSKFSLLQMQHRLHIYIFFCFVNHWHTANSQPHCMLHQWWWSIEDNSHDGMLYHSYKICPINLYLRHEWKENTLVRNRLAYNHLSILKKSYLLVFCFALYYQSKKAITISMWTSHPDIRCVCYQWSKFTSGMEMTMLCAALLGH